MCHPECSSLGCWGPENSDCLSCTNFQYDGQCLTRCTDLPGLYQVNSTTCDRCDPECSSTCSGAVSMGGGWDRVGGRDGRVVGQAAGWLQRSYYRIGLQNCIESCRHFRAVFGRTGGLTFSLCKYFQGGWRG